MPAIEDISKLREFTLRLSRTPKVGAVTFQKLLDKFKGIEFLYKAFYDNELEYLNVPDFVNLPLDMKFICVWEEGYPHLLKEINDPPIVLFYKGNLEAVNNNQLISVVGTRNVSQAGMRLTKDFTRELSAQGLGIVSGMAFGVDAAAHQSALENHSFTVAVLATAVDDPSPSRNFHLYKEILNNGGLILSDTFPGLETFPGMFASRNRIIAGLSKGTLVVEAPEKSGALITAQLALDYNRDVFAIPGDIEKANSVGCNSLIKEGKAKLVQTPQDILEEYSLFGSKEHKVDQPINLTEDEKSIYQQLLINPMTSEEILLQVDILPNHALSLLSMLELKSIIFKQSDNKYYVGK